MGRLASERHLYFSPSLAAEIGLNEAIAIQQIVFWVAETSSGIIDDNGDRWIYNTYENWQKQFPFWSRDTVKRVMTSLRDKEIIFVRQMNRSSHDRTNYYTVNWDHKSISERDSARTMGANPPHLSGANPPHLHPEENTEEKPSSDQQADRVPVEEIFNAYERILPGKPRVKIRDDDRKKAVRNLWKRDKRFQSLEFWEKYFEVVRDSQWLMSKSTFAFDWLMKPANFKKVAEGNYDNA